MIRVSQVFSRGLDISRNKEYFPVTKSSDIGMPNVNMDLRLIFIRLLRDVNRLNFPSTNFARIKLTKVPPIAWIMQFDDWSAPSEMQLFDTRFCATAFC